MFLLPMYSVDRLYAKRASPIHKEIGASDFTVLYVSLILILFSYLFVYCMNRAPGQTCGTWKRFHTCNKKYKNIPLIS